MNQLVIGAGEVGTALHAVLSRAHHTAIRDVEPMDAKADVLHICIPWSDQFVEIVHRYQAQHQADLVVVHSTVPVGTCDPEGWVHSPVRGRHPDLVESLTAFTKHVGGGRAGEAASILEAAGIPTATHDRAAETEAGKLWELVQLGQQVLVEQQIDAWCREHGLDADVVYRQFAETYNAGYSKLGDDHFVRPVLRHVPGPIGGHCIRQCSALLDHPLAQMVAES